MGKITRIETVAQRLLDKNPNLVQVVENNPGASYKALEPHISTRLCGAIGRDIDQFIPRQKLIWAIIDAVEGKSEDSTVW